MLPKKSKFKKLRAFFCRHKWSIIVIIFAFLVGAFFVWDSYTANNDTVLTEIKIKPKTIKKVNAPLSGRLVTEDIARKQPIAVVVENHPDARPQSGLNEADLVYETFAEGGITRFLAFFQTQEPQEIGPVRSAREYFVEWANAYRAPFAHVGGSAEALKLITKTGTHDLNQFYLGKYFWRDNARYAPHNVYTTVQKLREASVLKRYPLDNDNIPTFLFKNDKTESLPAAFTVKVNFNRDYAVSWAYNPDKNNFTRLMLGATQKDRVTGENIVAKNVVVLFTAMGFGVSQASGKPRSEIVTTGTGEAIIWLDGEKIEGTWKASKANPPKFFDTTGKEISLNIGTTWIDVVPLGTMVN